MTSSSQESGARVFQYLKPDLSQIARKRKTVWLGTTERLFATIQVHREGGEVTLHSHTHLDGFWFVLAGRVRFYADETTVCADLGPMEGVLIPRGEKYWFEAYGPDDLEIFQIECSDREMTKDEARAERGVLLRTPSRICSFSGSLGPAKETKWLAHTDRLFAAIERLLPGESAAHAGRHETLDSVWYVIEGELDVRTGTGQEKRIGAGQGILSRHGELLQLAAAEEPVGLLQVFCSNLAVPEFLEFQNALAGIIGLND